MAIALAPVPPIGGHPLLLFLLQVGLLLAVALLLGRLAVRCGLPAIVGELLTGVLLGPSLLGHLAPAWWAWLFPPDPAQFHLLDAFGQFGVLLLVGVTGLHLDFGLVRRRGATAARVSLPGFAVPLALGIAAGFAVPASLLAGRGDRPVFALFLGIAMCVSAIPVIAKTLLDLKLLHRDVGQLILVAGTVDDVLGWIGLSAVTAMATTGLRAGGVLRSVAFLVLFLVVAALVARPLVRRALRASTRSEGGTTVAVAVVVVVLCGVVTHALGLEAVFGALVGGVLVRAAGPDVLARLAPLRTLVTAVLAPVFFATAGLRVDLTALADPVVAVTALALLAIAVVGKFTGAWLGAWTSGLNRWEALALGAGLNARGVVEVVVAMVGLRLGVLSTATYTVVVLIAVVTSVMAPPILRFATARIEVAAEEEVRRAEFEPAAPAVGKG
ncbi:cation:proton antiporter [Saccharothrix xinjiangensis]|uniref:Cation:proton antiporter n=1 Tax=Saccharothrix xinjiangensis TaxID=204798 RepID=A0ABV9YDX9_9PSEU